MAVHAGPAAVQTVPPALAKARSPQGSLEARAQPSAGTERAPDLSSGHAPPAPRRGPPGSPCADAPMFENSRIEAEASTSDPLTTATELIDRAASAFGSLHGTRAAGEDTNEHLELIAAREVAQLRAAPVRADAPIEFRLESPKPAVVIPLSEGRYLVQFTADQPMQDKLTQAQELMRHEVPRGDFVAVFDRALDLLIADRKKKLFGLRTSSVRAAFRGQPLRRGVIPRTTLPKRQPLQSRSPSLAAFRRNCSGQSATRPAQSAGTNATRRLSGRAHRPRTSHVRFAAR